MKGKYESHVEPKIFLVECWARDGLTDEQIAKNLGVGYSTFREYKSKHPALLAALKKGKEVIDFEVENALLKRALGYEFSEEKVEIEQNAKGTILSRKVVQTVKQIPPDVGAAAFWLKNRKPDKWRDKPLDDNSDGILLGLIEGLKQNG